MNRPLLAYVATRWPWPIESGRQRMIAQMLEMASATHRVCLIVISNENEEAAVPPFVEKVARIPRPRIRHVFGDLIARPAEPLQSHLFLSQGSRAAIVGALADLAPDVVMVDMIRLAGLRAPTAREVPSARFIVDMDDRLSDRYRQMRINGETNLFGAFGASIPPFLQRFASFGPKAVLRVEEALVSRAERRAAEAQAVVFVSAREAVAYRDAVGPGCAVAAIAPVTGHREPAKRDFSAGVRFVFLGNAHYAPNAEALRTMDVVAGRLRQAGGARRFSFEAAGRGTDGLGLENVRGVGFAGDLDAFLDPSAVMVAPIATGTGIKTKLLDAMARGVPVIGSRKAVEGLNVEDGRDVLVRERPNLVGTLRDVLDGHLDGTLDQVGIAGASVMRADHDPDVVTAAFHRVLTGLRPCRRAARCMTCATCRGEVRRAESVG